VGKLELLPGVKASPELILRYALERVGDFKHIAVVALLDDDEGHVVCGWSDMECGALTFMEKVLCSPTSRKRSRA
jgi:hypothetical protein